MLKISNELKKTKKEMNEAERISEDHIRILHGRLFSGLCFFVARCQNIDSLRASHGDMYFFVFSLNCASVQSFQGVPLQTRWFRTSLASTCWQCKSAMQISRLWFSLNFILDNRINFPSTSFCDSKSLQSMELIENSWICQQDRLSRGSSFQRRIRKPTLSTCRQRPECVVHSISIAVE